MKKTMCTLALCSVAVTSWADWACTMPNGRVIYRQLSACPADAVASREVAAVPGTVRPEFKGTAQAPPGPMVEAAPKPATPLPVPRDIVNEAHAICALLKVDGASSCTVDVNVWSASVIDATWPGSARAAQLVCLGIANQTRAASSPFVGRGWLLQFFSPLGAGGGPFLSCRL